MLITLDGLSEYIKEENLKLKIKNQHKTDMRIFFTVSDPTFLDVDDFLEKYQGHGRITKSKINPLTFDDYELLN